MELFAENLKKLRKLSGLTQTQLAKQIGVNKSIVSAYENQLRMPSLDALIKLSHTFGVSMEYLLGINREKTLDVSGLNEEQVSAVAGLIELFKNSK